MGRRKRKGFVLFGLGGREGRGGEGKVDEVRYVTRYHGEWNRHSSGVCGAHEVGRR